MEHSKNRFAPSAACEEAHVHAGHSDAPPGPPTDAEARPLPWPSGERLDFEPVALAPRSGGWSPGKQRAFIEELADCGIVQEAAARVGMTERTARRLRRRADAEGFNIAWEAALRFGADRVRSIALERAIEGVVKPRFYHGKKVGEERVYDNRLLLALLARAQSIVSHVDAGRALADWNGWMTAIEKGAPPPRSVGEGEPPRVWPDVEGRWWTDFPPPSGFAGDHRGEPGDEDYCRICTADERAAIEAMEARKAAQEHRRRDAFFAGMASSG